MWVLYIQSWNIGSAFQEFETKEAAEAMGKAWEALSGNAKDPSSATTSNFYLVFPKK